MKKLNKSIPTGCFVKENTTENSRTRGWFWQAIVPRGLCFTLIYYNIMLAKRKKIYYKWCMSQMFNHWFLFVHCRTLTLHDVYSFQFVSLLARYYINKNNKKKYFYCRIEKNIWRIVAFIAYFFLVWYS